MQDPLCDKGQWFCKDRVCNFDWYRTSCDDAGLYEGSAFLYERLTLLLELDGYAPCHSSETVIEAIRI